MKASKSTMASMESITDIPHLAKIGTEVCRRVENDAGI